MDYKGKNVLITGAYQGIGKALATFFIEKGANVIITYHHHKNETIKLKEELQKKYYTTIDLYYLDLKNERTIKKLYNDIKEKYSIIDILINNAALSLDNYYMEKTKKDFMEVLEVNVVGTFFMIKYFTNMMNNGYIFNLSSTDGIDTGSVYSIDYNVSKAGINILTKTIGIDSLNTIISICPNWVDSESTRSMDKDYLNSELKRINQKDLISESLIPKVIDKCIKKHTKSGSIIRIDGDRDVR